MAKIIKKKKEEVIINGDVVNPETGEILAENVESATVESNEIPNKEILENVLAYVTKEFNLSEDYSVISFTLKGKKATIELKDLFQHVIKITLMDIFALRLADIDF